MKNVWKIRNVAKGANMGMHNGIVEPSVLNGSETRGIVEESIKKVDALK